MCINFFLGNTGWLISCHMNSTARRKKKIQKTLLEVCLEPVVMCEYKIIGLTIVKSGGCN